MVKFTLIGRLSDGLPLAQTPMYLNEENAVPPSYRQQGELVLKEISRGLSNTKMTLLIDHHCFHFLIGEGACYITVCDSWYPRKLAFHYLHDLLEEFEKVDIKHVASFSEPYAFTRFDYMIGKITKKYSDTRTQSNLSKLNSNRQQDLDIITKEFSQVINKEQTSDTDPSAPRVVLQMDLAFRNTKLLEVIALKWMPITMVVIVAALLLWTSLVVRGHD